MYGRANGFTLIELIVTIVIAGILMAMAAPAFTNFVRDARLGSQARALLSDIQMARSEAARLNQNVVLCPTNNDTACTTTWTQPRIVFADADNNQTIDTGQIALRKSDALSSNQTLIASPNSFVQFNSSGRPAAAVTFKLCDGRVGNFGRLVTVNLTGRSDLAITTCAANGT